MSSRWRCGIASTVVVAALCVAATAQAQTTKDQIIWNDPPAKTNPTPASDSGAASQAPIRDDYAPRAPAKPVAAHAADQPITWSEPSMPSKDKVGKSNTSASAAGPCREFQQDVVIDGKHQKAFGQACRQPDGTWKIVN